LGELIRESAKKPEAKREGKVPKIRKTGPSQSVSSPLTKSCSFKEPSGTRGLEGLSDQGLCRLNSGSGSPATSMSRKRTGWRSE